MTVYTFEKSFDQLALGMTAGPTFTDILTAVAKGWKEREVEECVLSLALPIRGVDPLYQLPCLGSEQNFRFLWDGSPGLCIAASGECQHFDLVGSRRFELAQRFSDATLGRLKDLTPEAPAQALPRIFLAFSFFENPSERKAKVGIPPAVQAVLPRWQLTRQGQLGWLRLNATATHEADARELAEQLWLMREMLLKSSEGYRYSCESPLGITEPHQWEDCYRPALNRAIELVEKGELKKLVLAVRQSILLHAPLDPLGILFRLRKYQAGSCRFLWQHSLNESFFGASPERLVSLRRGQLRSDALAGTASRDDDGQALLRSEKDRREHELVVSSISDQLLSQGLQPRRPRCPQLSRHGHLVHLHTPITADSNSRSPLHLVEALHPTPAVAGLPRKEAMSWLRSLEPFERGSYAAPIGWIDSSGDAEFRVAIRCGYSKGKNLHLTAGAGLVRGSLADRELQEVGLKLAVLADQLDLRQNFQLNSSSNRFIT